MILILHSLELLFLCGIHPARPANSLSGLEFAQLWSETVRLLHLVERLRLVADGEILEDEMTITDPRFYTAPVVVKHYWQRRPDIDVLEYFCGEAPRPDDEVSRSREGTR